jgi:uncharacterized membrane protein
MTLLVAGLALWWAAHLFRRLAPGPRAALTARMGDASKGIVALALLLSTALMVIGYRSADFVPLWDPPAFLRHLNNLMMVVSVALFGTGNSKSRLRGRLRHPMLLGFILWALAHLLVNGDLASLVLFGGLGVWAVAAILAINAQDRVWLPWTGGTPAGDARLAVIAVVVTGLIGLVHGWIGPSPFGG